MVKEVACKNCLSCAFRLLSQYKLCPTAYENLFLAYKYLVTQASHNARVKGQSRN